MRFAELELLRYGHFEDCHLRFPDDAIDLHVVFGPNEAGKSTSIEAINDLLFGFPHVTPYDFRFDKQLLRVGGRLQADGVDLVCRRKKGRIGTLLDAADRPVDEGSLSRLLAGYTGDGFKRMFSLDHARLREGGHAILTAADDVGQAIFAAGSGLVGVKTVLERLEAESKEIWTRRAGDRRYYTALAAFDEAKARQRAAQIKPAAWDDLQKHIRNLDAALVLLRGRRAALERERDGIERRRRVLPHAAVYRHLLDELHGLEHAPVLPAHAAEILEQVDSAVATAVVEADLATRERDEQRIALDAIVVDRRLIDQNADIDALRGTRGAVDKSLEDLPRRRAELATRARTVVDLCRELGWPNEPAARIAERLPPRARLAEIRSLLEQRSALDARMTGASDDEAAARQKSDSLRARFDALPPARDVAELSAALKLARSAGDLDGAVRTAEREAGKRLAALTASLAQLAPWTGDATALRNLVLPGDGEVAAVLALTAQSERALAEARQLHQAEIDRGAQLDLQRSQLLSDDRAVSREMIEAARQARDLLWRDLRNHVLGDAELPDPAQAADEFERRSNTADTIADRRYAGAEQSARLAVVQQEQERTALASAQAARRVQQAETACENAAATWRTLISAARLDMPPTAFARWAERRRRALEVAEEAQHADRALADARSRRDGALDGLRRALDAMAKTARDGDPLALLVGEAERLEAAEVKAAQERQTLEQELAGAAEQVRQAEAKRSAGARALADWQTRWEAAIEAAGLGAEASPAIIRSQLDLLEQLRAETSEILLLDQRIGAMEADIEAFGARVRSLAAACGLTAGETERPEAVLSDLAEAARQAEATAARQASLTERLVAAERRLADADAARLRALARLEPLFAAAGTTDRAELAAAIGCSDRVRHLRAETDRMADQILTAGAGPTLDALLDESRDQDAAALAIRGDALKEELTALSEELARVTGDHTTATSEFKKLDGGPDAAIAASDAAQARAEMAAQAEAYARKRAEISVLRWAIAGYRARKQTPLLERASALFAKLTLGRYVELMVDLESGDTGRLAGLNLNGLVVPVEAMSQGTVDQLFLALRIAAVEDTVAAGTRLPFLADDLFINYDDDRARAGFEVLAELAGRTQVLFFTHHQHLVSLAEEALGPAAVSRCALP